MKPRASNTNQKQKVRSRNEKEQVYQDQKSRMSRSQIKHMVYLFFHNFEFIKQEQTVLLGCAGSAM